MLINKNTIPNARPSSVSGTIPTPDSRARATRIPNWTIAGIESSREGKGGSPNEMDERERKTVAWYTSYGRRRKESLSIDLARFSKTRVFDSTYLPERVIISDGVNYQTHNRVRVGGRNRVDKCRSYTLHSKISSTILM